MLSIYAVLHLSPIHLSPSLLFFHYHRLYSPPPYISAYLVFHDICLFCTGGGASAHPRHHHLEEEDPENDEHGHKHNGKLHHEEHLVSGGDFAVGAFCGTAAGVWGDRMEN
jgi:hypothetical protein